MSKYRIFSFQDETIMEAPEPAKVHGFKCPICMAPFVEETTTRCGHIFCKKCIETAITAHHICPTCGKNATHKALVRVFLPNFNWRYDQYL